jgi:hypothetical protein
MLMSEVGQLITDAVTFGLCLGLVIGACLVGITVMAYFVMRQASLKKYYRMLDDANKKELLDTLMNMETQASFMAVKTNTSYFKSLNNEFVAVIAFLKRMMLG